MKEMTVDVRIVGTERDSMILKEALRLYQKTARKRDAEECESLIDLVEYAERRARAARENGQEKGGE